VSQAVQTQQGSEKGLIVASKNSKIYHWPWCAPAKKIKPENEVWFVSEAEARASGRTRCADFEELAPAGYLK
jgi:methylphosphotriester-DNA--protein-cysteine methyltransferase